jgi:hypothetical protein
MESVRRDGTTYNTTLESEGERCRSVCKFDGAAGIRVVIGHRTEEGGVLCIAVVSPYSLIAGMNVSKGRTGTGAGAGPRQLC